MNHHIKREDFHFGLRNLNDLQRHYEQMVEKEFGITPVHLELLVVLCQHGPMRMKDAASYFGGKLSTFTNIVDKAEKKHLVSREVSLEDRREILLDATSQGVAIYKAYRQYIDRAAERITSQLPPELVSDFVEGLGAVEELLGKPGKTRLTP